MYLVFLPVILTAYLLGSIPFGLLIAKAHGKDLRNIGSGNIGATNVSRALGRKWAYICFALDVLKGFVPTVAILFIANPNTTQSYIEKVIIFWLWLQLSKNKALRRKFRELRLCFPQIGSMRALWAAALWRLTYRKRLRNVCKNRPLFYIGLA